MKNLITITLAASLYISTGNAQQAAPTATPTPKKSTGLVINKRTYKPKTTTTKTSTTGKATTTPSSTSTGSTSNGTKGGMGGKSDSNNGGTTSSGKPDMGGKGSGTNTGGGIPGQAESSNAIKQALLNGIQAAVSELGASGGFLNNPLLKIPLPAELQPVDEGLRAIGMGQYVDKLVAQLNESAEKSVVQATPIFTSSIQQLTITDAVNIVTGAQQDAATQFLKRTTSAQLVNAFKPSVKSVLDQTMTTDAYSQVMGIYNKIPFVSPASTDLPDYVTRKALDGLFIKIAEQEVKIRQNPAATGSSVLGKVFGKVLGK